MSNQQPTGNNGAERPALRRVLFPDESVAPSPLRRSARLANMRTPTTPKATLTFREPSSMAQKGVRPRRKVKSIQVRQMEECLHRFEEQMEKREAAFRETSMIILDAVAEFKQVIATHRRDIEEANDSHISSYQPASHHSASDYQVRNGNEAPSNRNGWVSSDDGPIREVTNPTVSQSVAPQGSLREDDDDPSEHSYRSSSDGGDTPIMDLYGQPYATPLREDSFYTRQGKN